MYPGFPSPNNTRQLRAFLGLVNFYRKFLPYYAQVLLPLINMLTNVNSSITLSECTVSAFKKIKAMLSNTIKSFHIQPNHELCLAVDTSAVAFGAVLQRRCKSEWRPILFFSRKLTEAETRYSTFDRELLAKFAAILYYRPLLKGQQFHNLTDHKLLLGALKSSPEKYSPREIRQMPIGHQTH